jgi:hypothetical protein
MIPPHKGADTLLWLATSRPGHDWKPGGYYVKRRAGRTSPQANDAQLARELWIRSEAAIEGRSLDSSPASS